MLHVLHRSNVNPDSWKFLLKTISWHSPGRGHPRYRYPWGGFLIFLPARWTVFDATWPGNVLHNAFWGRSAGQVNVTRAGFAVSYFVSHTCWQPLPQRVISANINDATAVGIYALRRLKFKRCGELASRLSSRLTFAYLCVVVRANLTVNMPLRIRVGVHRVFPLTQLYRKCWISIKIEDGLRRSSSRAPSGSIVKVEYQWVTKTTNRFTNLNSKKCKKVKFSTFTQHFVSYYDLSLLSCLN